ncbi:hypothetical protein Hte_009404 [Hypoxylon texense]
MTPHTEFISYFGSTNRRQKEEAFVQLAVNYLKESNIKGQQVPTKMSVIHSSLTLKLIYTVNMFSNTISVVGLTLTILSTQALGRKCHLETTVYHRQNSACGSGSCIPGDTFGGSGVLKIDGDVKWDGDGASYDKLSNGKGVDVDAGGVKFHVDPLGIPDAQDKPSCKVHIGDYTNLGKQDTDDVGLPGVVGKGFDCTHDWNC